MTKRYYFRTSPEQEILYAEKLVDYFLSHTLSESRINDIIDILEIGKSTFYRNFQNVEEVYIYTYEYITRPLRKKQPADLTFKNEESFIDQLTSESFIGNRRHDILHYIILGEMRYSKHEQLRLYIENNERVLKKRLEKYLYFAKAARMFQNNVKVQDVHQILLHSRALVYDYIRRAENFDALDIPQFLYSYFHQSAFGILRDNRITHFVFNQIFHSVQKKRPLKK